MGNLLDTLTFSESNRRTENTDPKINLRRKMAAALDHQIAGAEAELKGDTYTIPVEKWVVADKATGAKERAKVQKTLRRMWFRDASDRIMIELRFANKPISVNGKPSIVVGAMDKLVPTLTTIRKAVMQGELDAALKVASDSRKRTLKLPKAGTTTQAPKAGK